LLLIANRLLVIERGAEGKLSFSRCQMFEARARLIDLSGDSQPPLATSNIGFLLPKRIQPIGIRGFKKSIQ
jgi:hypothetical protein